MSLFGTLKGLRFPKPKLAFFGIPKLTDPDTAATGPKGERTLTARFFSQEIHGDDLGVSENRGTPKWMVYNGESL